MVGREGACVVVPAEAGTHTGDKRWMPACAGKTNEQAVSPSLSFP
jgi:hypothetical protein